MGQKYIFPIFAFCSSSHITDPVNTLLTIPNILIKWYDRLAHQMSAVVNLVLIIANANKLAGSVPVQSIIP